MIELLKSLIVFDTINFEVDSDDLNLTSYKSWFWIKQFDHQLHNRLKKKIKYI